MHYEYRSNGDMSACMIHLYFYVLATNTKHNQIPKNRIQEKLYSHIHFSSSWIETIETLVIKLKRMLDSRSNVLLIKDKYYEAQIRQMTCPGTPQQVLEEVTKSSPLLQCSFLHILSTSLEPTSNSRSRDLRIFAFFFCAHNRE